MDSSIVPPDDTHPSYALYIWCRYKIMECVTTNPSLCYNLPQGGVGCNELEIFT